MLQYLMDSRTIFLFVHFFVKKHIIIHLLLKLHQVEQCVIHFNKFHHLTRISSPPSLSLSCISLDCYPLLQLSTAPSLSYLLIRN